MNCPECDRPLFWSGRRYDKHTEMHHALYRRAQLRAIAGQLLSYGGIRQWETETAFRKCVGIRWRNGVYPGWRTECRTEIPYEVWDLGEQWQQDFLRDSREGNTWWLKARHGLDVNQATWFHKIYDGRQT